MDWLYHILGLCPDHDSHLNLIQVLMGASGLTGAIAYVKAKFLP